MSHVLQIIGLKCEDLFKVIIFPYLSAKRKVLGYTFKGQDNEEMKRL